MKTSYFSSILIIILLAGCGKTSDPQGRSATNEAEPPKAAFNHSAPETLRLGVPDMTCHNCVAKIRTGMAGLKGVDAIDCDTLGHMVYVRLINAPAGRAADSVRIVQAIRQAGFTVTAGMQ